MRLPKKPPHKVPKFYRDWYEVAEHFRGEEVSRVTHAHVRAHAIIFVWNRDQRGVISKALRKTFGSRWNKKPYKWDYVSSARRDTDELGSTPIYDGHATAQQIVEVCYWVRRISEAEGWSCPCEVYGEIENTVDYKEQDKDWASLNKRFGRVEESA